MVSLSMLSCANEGMIDKPVTPTPNPPIVETIEFKNRSITPSLVALFPEFSGVEIFPLISSEDTIRNAKGMIYGGAPDGQGIIPNPDGSGYILLNNHENTWAMSRLFLNKKFDIINGDYLVNSDGGLFRLCSGTMATPAIHGFGPVFLAAGEQNPNAMVQAISPLGVAMPTDKSRVKPALGKFSSENAVPLPKVAYPNRTVILISEDADDSQIYLYLSETVGDLENGKLYVLRRKDLNQVETAMTWNKTYEVEFVEVPNAKNLSGEQIEALNASLKTIKFSRAEDLDYRKGSAANNREIYFAATGIRGASNFSYMGRVYQLKLDENNPLMGQLKIVADGDISPTGEKLTGFDIINPDNICVTENYVYIQEDGDAFFPEATHESYVWQYTIATGVKKPFIRARNGDADILNTKYNPAVGNQMQKGLWEYGAMTDISDVVGVPGTFLLNIQPHSWVEGDKFLNPSKANLVLPYKAGGQTVLLKNVPR